MAFITNPTGSIYAEKTNWRERPAVRTAQQWLSAEDLNQVRSALVEIAGVINEMSDYNPSFGELYVDHEVPVVFTASVQNVYMKFAPYVVSASVTSSLLQLGEFDPNGNVIAAPLSGGFIIGPSGSGHYHVSMNVSFNVSDAGLWEGAVFVNDAESAKMAMYVTAPVADQVVSMNMNGMTARLLPGDIVDVRSKWKSGPGSEVGVEVNSYNFTIRKEFNT